MSCAPDIVEKSSSPIHVPARSVAFVSIVIYHSLVTGKEVIRRLRAAGWVLNRVHGSHHILCKGSQAVPVPIHGSRDLGAGLLAAIQRQTGVKMK